MKGQITVFLSAILLVLLSILCSVFEFSRQRVLEFYLDCGIEATKESCLADYHRELWEGYGIFSMYDDGRIEEFIKENLMVYGDCGQNWYPFRVVSTGFFSKEGLCDNHGEAFRRMAVSYMKAGLGEGEIVPDGENIELIEKGITFLKHLDEEYGDLTVNFEKVSKDGEETEEDREQQEKEGFLISVINGLKDLKNTAVSTLIFPGLKFSEREIEAVRNEKTLADGGNLTMLDEMLFKIYVSEKFPTLLEDAGGYDLEYILGTSASDKENLLEAAGELLLVREGMNLMYLSTSDLRQTELDAMAVLLAAFVGLPEFITAVKYFLMLCWAFAEAVCDVKTLVNGGRVPLQKSNRTWHTDLESLVFGGGEETYGGSENGLSYEDYLKILLMLQKEEKIALRALEVMQWRIRERSPGFLITRCVTEADYEVCVEAERFFRTMFIREDKITFMREGELAYE